MATERPTPFSLYGSAGAVIGTLDEWRLHGAPMRGDEHWVDGRFGELVESRNGLSGYSLASNRHLFSAFRPVERLSFGVSAIRAPAGAIPLNSVG